MANTAQKKQKKNRRDFLIALVLLMALIAAVLVIVFVLPKLSSGDPTKNDPSRQAAEMPYEVPGFTLLEDVSGTTFDNGLSVLCCGTYSGFYLEDGSDEQVKDVLSVVIKNNGASLVEYGVIELPLGKQTATFEFSGLPVGAAVLVQEKNRMTDTNGIQKASFVCSQYALPGSIVLDFGNDFELYTDDGVINMKNISGADITTDVSVFYKNFEFGLFLGGITYRARVSGGIKDGEIGQALQNHFWADTSAVLYMSYGK